MCQVSNSSSRSKSRSDHIARSHFPRDRRQLARHAHSTRQCWTYVLDKEFHRLKHCLLLYPMDVHTSYEVVETRFSLPSKEFLGHLLWTPDDGAVLEDFNPLRSPTQCPVHRSLRRSLPRESGTGTIWPGPHSHSCGPSPLLLLEADVGVYFVGWKRLLGSSYLDE